MTLPVDALHLVEDLVDCRNVLRFLHGNEYDRLIQPWRAILRVPPARPRSLLLAYAIQIAHDEFGDNSEAHARATLWLFAAAVDLITEQPGAD